MVWITCSKYFKMCFWLKGANVRDSLSLSPLRCTQADAGPHTPTSRGPAARTGPGRRPRPESREAEARLRVGAPGRAGLGHHLSALASGRRRKTESL